MYGCFLQRLYCARWGVAQWLFVAQRIVRLATQASTRVLPTCHLCRNFWCMHILVIRREMAKMHEITSVSKELKANMKALNDQFLQAKYAMVRAHAFE